MGPSPVLKIWRARCGAEEIFETLSPYFDIEYFDIALKISEQVKIVIENQ